MEMIRSCNATLYTLEEGHLYKDGGGGLVADSVATFISI